MENSHILVKTNQNNNLIILAFVQLDLAHEQPECFTSEACCVKVVMDFEAQPLCDQLHNRLCELLILWKRCG